MLQVTAMALAVMLLNTASFHAGRCRHKVLLSLRGPLLGDSKLSSSYRRPGAEPVKKLSWQNADFSFKKGIDHLKTQLSLLKEETQDYLKGPGGHRISQRLLEQTKVLWQFRSQEDLNKWVISSDVEIGGKSKVYIKLGRNNQAALLYGTLNTDAPRDGETKYSGYCSMRSRPAVVSSACTASLPDSEGVCGIPVTASGSLLLITFRAADFISEM